MASQKVTAALASIELSLKQNKPQLYNELLSQIVSTPSQHELARDLLYFFDSILNENISIVVMRALVDSFSNVLRDLPPDVKVKVGQHALESLPASVEEQDSRNRETIADAYDSQEEYISEALALQGIRLDSSDSVKTWMWIRIVRVCLVDDDAEAFLSKIKNMENIQTKVVNGENGHITPPSACNGKCIRTPVANDNKPRTRRFRTQAYRRQVAVARGIKFTAQQFRDILMTMWNEGQGKVTDKLTSLVPSRAPDGTSISKSEARNILEYAINDHIALYMMPS